jgi:myo-inositol 2-dehydrogenase/D-chiro-inositol 1-dehydrogenase
VAGSGGFIEYDSRVSPALRTANQAGVFTESPLVPGDDPYFSELRAFLDAVRKGEEPPVTGLDGLRAVAISEAVIESARSGNPVAVASS